MRRFSPFAMLMILLISALILSACGDGDDNSINDAINALNDPNSNTSDSGEVIQWDTHPETVIFRAEAYPYAEADGFFTPAGIPDCAIYGDQRVVWLVEAADPADGVLVGTASGRDIRNFIASLVYDGFYTYEANVDLQFDPGMPTVRQMMLTVNGQTHGVDEYGGVTEEYYDYYLEFCRILSQQPRVFRPDGLWIRVQAVTYNINAPSILWSSDVTGLDLAAIAESGEPYWVTDRLAHLLWGYSRRAPLNLQYTEQGQTFVLTVEVPGVSRGALPAPADATSGEE